MKKILGWILALIGLFFVAFGVEVIRPSVLELVPSLSFIDSIFSMAFGFVLLFFGILLIRFSKSKGMKMKDIELPIFQGNKIIGYRRN